MSREAPLESAVTAKILKYLRAQGAFAEKVHTDAIQAGLLDIIACYKGFFLHLEVKRAPGLKATPRQQYIIQKVKDAGGIAETVSSVESVAELLRQIEERDATI